MSLRVLRFSVSKKSVARRTLVSIYLSFLLFWLLDSIKSVSSFAWSRYRLKPELKLILIQCNGSGDIVVIRPIWPHCPIWKFLANWRMILGIIYPMKLYYCTKLSMDQRNSIFHLFMIHIDNHNSMQTFKICIITSYYVKWELLCPENFYQFLIS